MSKNITIAEGTQAKNFNTVHKLRTNLIGGGTQYWVPEDEAGAYANMGQKSITANGTYRASDDSKDGYSQVIVNVPPTRPNLTTKNISQNGTYRASDDGADGYSQVIVSGVEGTVGLLPESMGGDSNEYYLTTDAGEQVIKKDVPSEIRITTAPTKRNYIIGEPIDITGMVVKAYKNDGTIWNADGYSQGIIPNSELIFEPTTAMIDADNMYKTDGNGINIIYGSYSLYKFKTGYTDPTGEPIYSQKPIWPVQVGNYGAQAIVVGGEEVGEDGAQFYLTQYDNKIYGKSLNEFVRTTGFVQLIFGVYKRYYGTDEGIYPNRWTELSILRNHLSQISDNIPTSTRDPRGTSSTTYYSDGMTLNVKWRRPQDNKMLSTFMKLNVSTS